MAWFSNATEGDAWTNVWCERCIHDHAAHDGNYEDGCPLFVFSLVENYDDDKPVTGALWRERTGAPFHLPPDVECLMFTPCTKCDHPDGRDEEAAEYRSAVRVRIREALKESA